jgi:hypothetical protein
MANNGTIDLLREFSTIRVRGQASSPVLIETIVVSGGK